MVSDALDRLNLGSVVSNVPQCSGDGRIAGRAITVKLGTSTGAIPTRHLCTTAVELGGPETIVVVEQRTGVDAGSWGGLLTLGAHVKRIAGVVLDGPVRDLDEARAIGFPIFCRSTTARTARRRIVEIATNVPVMFETVQVQPGDYVLADRSGVAFIDPEHIDEVLRVGESIAATEREMVRAIEAGVPIGQVMAARYEGLTKNPG
jgi:4-hydroxy-4-methyl-2-oxoglutarate aldolase